MLLSIQTLILYIAASWARLLIALVFSIVFSIAVGVTAATNKKLEKIILPVLDVLQTLPILAFFPVVIAVVVNMVPNQTLGVEIAVVFLIFTSMSWNITFGVYEAVKAIPSDLKDLAAISKLTSLQVVKKLYIPASMPTIAYQSAVSWSVGLFYLVASEIFSTGSANFSVHYGIGVAIANIVLSQNLTQYAVILLLLIAAIILTRMLFLHPFSIYSERFSFNEEQRAPSKSPILNLYSRFLGIVQKFIPKFSIRLRSKIFVPVQEYETRHEKKKRRSRSLTAFFILSLIAFIATLIITRSYSYLPAIAQSLTFSFARIWFMYFVCALVAVPIGVKIAKSAKAFEPSLSLVQIISAIPAPILLPAIVAIVYVLPFGNEITALAVIFLSMVWYVLFSVISGMRSIPAQFPELSRIFGLRWVTVWKKIYLPAILPSFITGSVTAIGGGWNALIVAEYFSVQGSGGASIVVSQVGNGIGKLLDQASFVGNYPLMALALFSLVVMVVMINRFVWQRLYNYVTLRYRIEA